MIIGFSKPEIKALRQICQGESTLGELAVQLKVTPGFVSRPLRSLEEKGLIALINNRIILLNTSSNIKFSFEHNGNPETLSSIANIAIFRIMLEAINNIVKHAGATEASINLQIGGNITLTVTDNGKGFETDNIDKGLGLYTMRARTEAMKGTFEIVSDKGTGTHITIIIPTKYHNN